jgi:hypothetical protein
VFVSTNRGDAAVSRVIVAECLTSVVVAGRQVAGLLRVPTRPNDANRNGDGLRAYIVRDANELIAAAEEDDRRGNCPCLRGAKTKKHTGYAGQHSAREPENRHRLPLPLGFEALTVAPTSAMQARRPHVEECARELAAPP